MDPWMLYAAYTALTVASVDRTIRAGRQADKAAETQKQVQKTKMRRENAKLMAAIAKQRGEFANAAAQVGSADGSVALGTISSLEADAAGGVGYGLDLQRSTERISTYNTKTNTEQGYSSLFQAGANMAAVGADWLGDKFTKEASGVGIASGYTVPDVSRDTFDVFAPVGR